MPCVRCCAAGAISATRCNRISGRAAIWTAAAAPGCRPAIAGHQPYGRGLGTRQIASLSLSVKTVETHRLTIKRKLGLDTNAQLVQYAIKWHGTPAG
jgi:hypothetical protein